MLLASLANVDGQRLELQPTAGVGFAGALQNPYFDNGGDLPAYSVAIGVALHAARVQISTGISFFTTGYSSTGEFTLTDPYGLPLGTTYGTYRFRFLHIGVPVTAGLVAPVTKHFEIVYSLGLMPAYNITVRKSFSSGLVTYKLQTVPKEDFDRYYSRFTLFGLAQVSFQYRLQRGLKIFAGPVFRPMITSSSAQLREREFALTFDVGAGIPLQTTRLKK